MAFDYESMHAMAVELVGEFGTPTLFEKLSGAAADPDKPWNGPGTPTVAESTTIPAVMVPPSEWLGMRGFDEELTKRFEQFFIAAPLGNTPDLREYHAVSLPGEPKYRILQVQLLAPAGLKLLYYFGVER